MSYLGLKLPELDLKNRFFRRKVTNGVLNMPKGVGGVSDLRNVPKININC